MTNYTARASAGSSLGAIGLVALVLSVAFLSTAQTAALAKVGIHVVVNGDPSSEGAIAYDVQGEAFWAVGPLLNAIGGKVRWEGNEARAESMGHHCTVYADSSTWVLDGSSMGLPRKTFMHHGSLYVPMATIVESLGYHFRYDPDDRTAYINTRHIETHEH